MDEAVFCKHDGIIAILKQRTTQASMHESAHISLGSTQSITQSNHSSTTYSNPSVFTRSLSFHDAADLALVLDQNCAQLASNRKRGLGDAEHSARYAKIARYLTAKGATIDQDIQWCSLERSSSSAPAIHCDDHLALAAAEPGSAPEVTATAHCGRRSSDYRAGFDHPAAALSAVWPAAARPEPDAEKCGSGADHLGLSMEELRSTAWLEEPPAAGAPPERDAAAFARPHSVAARARRDSGDDSSARLLASWCGRALPTPPRPAPLCLSAHTAQHVTVMFIDIKGFTEGCAEMTALAAGEWVADFYARVDRAAAACGVRKVEVRGDCCICVAGDDEPAEPGAATTEDDDDVLPDGEGDGDEPARAPPTQATRALAFATALNSDLAGLGTYGCGRPIRARMGIATGPVAFLVGEAAAAAAAAALDGASLFASVQGDTVNVAARMEALSCPGVAVVHKTAVDQWAAETGRRPPRTACCRVKGKGLQRAAVYDCAAGAFAADAGGLLPEAALRSLGRGEFRAPMRRSSLCLADVCPAGPLCSPPATASTPPPAAPPPPAV